MTKAARQATGADIPVEVTEVAGLDTQHSTIVGFSVPDRFRLQLIGEIAASLASPIYAKNILDGKPGMPEQVRKEIVRDATKLADEILKVD